MKANSIVKNFKVTGDFMKWMPYGSGHIHDTYLIRTSSHVTNEYLLQKINHHVFNDVPNLMENIERVTGHISQKLHAEATGSKVQECLTVIQTIDSKPYYEDGDGNFWRMYLFISGSTSIDYVNKSDDAYQSGIAFGKFIRLVSDLRGERLHETIPEFHNMESRLHKFYKTVRKNPASRLSMAKKEIKFVENRAEEMLMINRLAEQGAIPERITHNDTKINNVLFDENGIELCVIDLDTVMPGLVHYDFGDAIRTVTNTGAEDEMDLEKVSMNPEYFTAFSQGFLSETKSFLTKSEIETLAFSAKMMTFIIGLRFLTDFIDGDKYYKIKRENHNLERAKVQFKLLESMVEQTDLMEEIIKKYAY
ncbi:aminoglycoside phosphotransferase family protein [candidate division KSB1 bacterium]|nr:aminoglycoside phosphotransferase family protein [candidate division KSB1 bacterium]